METIGNNPDEDFPACCGYCPYREPVIGSCTHELRQHLAHTFVESPDATCPVYEAEKTKAMDALLARLAER